MDVFTILHNVSQLDSSKCGGVMFKLGVMSLRWGECYVQWVGYCTGALWMAVMNGLSDGERGENHT